MTRSRWTSRAPALAGLAALALVAPGCCQFLRSVCIPDSDGPGLRPGIVRIARGSPTNVIGFVSPQGDDLDFGWYAMVEPHVYPIVYPVCTPSGPGTPVIYQNVRADSAQSVEELCNFARSQLGAGTVVNVFSVHDVLDASSVCPPPQ